jgi:hypothetical protein
LAIPQVACAQQSPVSTFWSSVAKSARSQACSVVAGYALTALGLFGPSQQDADLTDSLSLLTQLDSELSSLASTIQTLKCLTAQDQSPLTASIVASQGLYDTHEQWVNDSPTVPCYHTSDTPSEPCFGQTGVSTWLTEVTDPESRVQANLDAIAEAMIQSGNTGVIYQCVVTITDNYNNGKGPKQNVFDDVYYSQVQQLTNYYYGVQAQGAALLSEAYHL